MENLNKKLDSISLKGIIKDIRIVNKSEIGIFSVVQKQLTEACFDTSKGFMKVEVTVSIIQVDNTVGKFELLAGTRVMETTQMIQYLIDKNVSFDELAEEVSKIRNYRAILRSVENKVKFESKFPSKEPIQDEELEIASTVEIPVPVKKQLPKMGIITEIPVYKEVPLTAYEKKVMQDIIHAKDIASSFFDKSKIISIFSKTKR